MKKHTVITLLTAVAVIATLGSCSRTPHFLGKWISAMPENITEDVSNVARATSQLSMEFSQGKASAATGVVTLSSVIDITQPVNGDSSFVEPYEVSIAATANISGVWAFAGDSDDDLVLSFDMSTLDVDVDPHGVSFSQNLLTGAQRPTIDSLTSVTVNLWKHELHNVLLARLTHFSMLDDVEVNKDGNLLTFEIKNSSGHERKYAFKRVFSD